MYINMNQLYKPFVTCLNKLYDEYGEEFAKLNGLHNTNLNFNDFITKFVETETVADATIDGNANSSSHDIRTLMSDMTKPHTKLLAFNKIFYETTKKYGLQTAEKWLTEEWTGAFYLHDASTSTFLPYCFAYDLDLLVENGLFFINKFKTSPPRHLTTFNDHVLEFVSWNANRTSGAVGLPSYLVYSYYFWKHDVEQGIYLKDPEYYRRQCFQKFIYDLNQPYLRIIECAFTNITIMDRPYLTELFGGREYPDGTFVIDYIEDIIEHQKVFMEVVADIRKDTMMTFPVLTYSLLYQDGKFVDEEFARWCNKHNMQWYDSNFYVGSDVTSLSNCCRLISNTTKLTGFINSIGGTSLSIGSIKVNTINLRRISLESGRDEEKYIDILTDRVDTCVKILDIQRGIIKRNIEKGLLPNYTYKLIDLNKQYSTIGITALYEVMCDFGYIKEDKFGAKSYTPEGIKFAKRILSKINELKDAYDYQFSFNVEAIPAERANIVLCNKDNKLYPECTQYFIYSNQWISLMEKCRLSEKVKLGAILDKECNGGQIAHITIDGPMASEEQSWRLLNLMAQKGLVYFAFNSTISVCEDEHAFYGDICPRCGKPKIDEYTRVVGFLTPKSSWSKERKLEGSRRQPINLQSIEAE